LGAPFGRSGPPFTLLNVFFLESRLPRRSGTPFHPPLSVFLPDDRPSFNLTFSRTLSCVLENAFHPPNQSDAFSPPFLERFSLLGEGLFFSTFPSPKTLVLGIFFSFVFCVLPFAFGLDFLF